MILLIGLASACEVDALTLRSLVAAGDAAAVQAAIPCLRELLPAEDAAGLHALLGPTEGEAVPVPLPERGDLWFDGVLRATRPGGASLFQQTGPDGQVVQSAWLRAEDPLPAYLAGEEARVRRGKLGPGAIGFGGAGIASFLAGAAVAASGVEACQLAADCGQRDVGLGLMGGSLALLALGAVAIRVGF